MCSEAKSVEWIDVCRIFSLKQYMTNVVWYDHTPLVTSVKHMGIICPIMLRKTEMNRFEIIDGEKRLRAAVICGMRKVPAVILNCTSDEAICLHFHLRCLHTEPHFFDIAYFYATLQKQGWSVHKIASNFCLSILSVEQKLSLLQHPEDRIKKIMMHGIEESVAVSLLSLDKSVIDRTLDYIISNHINTQGAIQYIQTLYKNDNFLFTSSIVQIVRSALRKATVLAEREQLPVQMREQNQKDTTVFLFKIKNKN